MTEVKIRLEQLPILQSLIFGLGNGEKIIAKGLVYQDITEGDRYKLRKIGKLIETEGELYNKSISDIKTELGFTESTSFQEYVNSLKDKKPEAVELEKRLAELSKTEITLSVDKLEFNDDFKKARFGQDVDYSLLYDVFFEEEE